MLNYIKAHWRGELSLSKSYWINVFVLSAILKISADTLFWLVNSKGQDLQLDLAMLSLISSIVILTWQFVGSWRSATRSSKENGRIFWASIVKLLCILAVVTNIFLVATTTHDVLAAKATLHAPFLTQYKIERRGKSTLVLKGAINDQSSAEAISALSDGELKQLRVISNGGLVKAAIRLARHIRSHDTFVVAEGRCVSACVIVLAASPKAAIIPGAKIVFHRFQPLADTLNPLIKRATDESMQKALSAYQEMGIASWAINMASSHDLWAPTIDQMVDMGLIKYIYDIDKKEFVRAIDYCVEHHGSCNK